MNGKFAVMGYDVSVEVKYCIELRKPPESHWVPRKCAIFLFEVATAAQIPIGMPAIEHNVDMFKRRRSVARNQHIHECWKKVSRESLMNIRCEIKTLKISRRLNGGYVRKRL